MTQYLAALWDAWWALMGSGAFTIISLIAALRKDSNRTTAILTAIAAVAFFFVASYRAWRDKADELTKYTDSRVVANIDMVAIGNDPNGVVMHMIVSLTNNGALISIDPRSWTLRAIFPNGQPVQASAQPFSKDPLDLCLGQDLKLRLVQADALYLKAAKGLGRGYEMYIQGAISFQFLGTPANFFSETPATLQNSPVVMELEARDTGGTKVHVSDTFGAMFKRNSVPGTFFSGLENPRPIHEACTKEGVY